MTENRTREVVVEYEEVRRVRKRSTTLILFCTECSKESDFIALAEASKLFYVASKQLSVFIADQHCHSLKNAQGLLLICLVSLLNNLKVERIRVATGRQICP